MNLLKAVLLSWPLAMACIFSFPVFSATSSDLEVRSSLLRTIPETSMELIETPKTLSDGYVIQNRFKLCPGEYTSRCRIYLVEDADLAEDIAQLVEEFASRSDEEKKGVVHVKFHFHPDRPWLKVLVSVDVLDTNW